MSEKLNCVLWSLVGTALYSYHLNSKVAEEEYYKYDLNSLFVVHVCSLWTTNYLFATEWIVTSNAAVTAFCGK